MADENRPRTPISADWILKRIQDEKEVRLRNAIIEGDIDLDKLDLPTESIEQTELRKKMAWAEDVKIVQSSIKITNSTIQGRLDFSDLTFKRDTRFDGVTFSEGAGFKEATFSGDTGFKEATFKREAEFDGSKFEGDVLTFRNATFILAQSQEKACRKAKNVLEKNGDREEAGYHFYREMEGKRKQKPWYLRYPEYVFIQLIFGYGVHPLRLWACWIGFVVLFAVVYWFGHGIDAVASQLQGDATLKDYIWFSIATAVTPGYAGYKPTTDFKLVAGLEAIFGTFMWASFIATFARKYMR